MRPIAKVALIALLACSAWAQVTITSGKAAGVRIHGVHFVVATNTLPGGQVGTAYSQQLASSGGVGGVTWAVSSGSLPTSLSLSSGGLISGTPTVNGTFTFTVLATDSASNTAPQTFTIIITPLPLSITTTSPLPNGTQGSAYSTTLAATGGATPYTWAVTAGSLPAGLSLDPVSGIISVTDVNAETQNFTVQVTDSQTT